MAPGRKYDSLVVTDVLSTRSTCRREVRNGVKMLAKCTIGMMGSPFWGVFGDPTIVLRYASPYTPRVIKFPERRNEIAKLRTEIEEMRKTVSVCAEAV